MMDARSALLALGAVAAVALSACGDGPPTSSSGSASNPNIQPVSAGPGAVLVKMTDSNTFDSTSVNAKVGDIVEWDNPSSATHNVTFDNGPASDSLDTNSKYFVKFTGAGTYTYQCTIHAGMTGKVVVG